MNNLIKSLKENTISFDKPFKHWEFNQPLTKDMIDEAIAVKIPLGEHSYDGTRAADHTGGGIDGKLRLFIDKKNFNFYPHLTSLIKTLQSKECQKIISKYIEKNLKNSFVRLEVIADKQGFWLKPHKDIKEKIMTMMIWINHYNELENLGTDFYDDNFNIIKSAKYIDNSGYLFSSGNDTWHGLEKKEIIKERRCLQINYVSFDTDWPVDQ